MEDNLVRKLVRIAEIARCWTAIDTYLMEANLSGAQDAHDAMSVYNDHGVAGSRLLYDDVLAVCTGGTAKYFIEDREFVASYLSRVPINQDTIDRCPPTHACKNEARMFYMSDEWARRRRLAYYQSGYRCSECRKAKVLLHVHHEYPIFSAHCRDFHKNFYTAFLSVLCRRCHEIFHATRARGEYGFSIVGNSAQAPDDHDLLKNCVFCYPPSNQPFRSKPNE